VSYVKLCTVGLFHEYFGGQLWSDKYVLHLDPTMQALCKNQCLMVRGVADKIVVIHEIDKTSNDHDGDSWLHIGVEFVGSDFFRFGESGLHPNGTVLQCVGGDKEIDSNISWLHDGDSVGNSQIKPRKKLAVQASDSRVSLVISLNLKHLLSELYSAKSEELICPANYGIKFAAKRVPWLYWLWIKQEKTTARWLNQQDRSYGLSIAPEQSTSVSFNAFGDVILMCNQRGFRFLSSVPIRLGCGSELTLSLCAESEVGTKILIDKLPHPAKDCLELLVIEQQKTVVAASHIVL
jgi:hypothetical protein